MCKFVFALQVFKSYNIQIYLDRYHDFVKVIYFWIMVRINIDNILT